MERAAALEEEDVEEETERMLQAEDWGRLLRQVRETLEEEDMSTGGEEIKRCGYLFICKQNQTKQTREGQCL